jgi:GNAT superfamily N-acetyltransferase
VIETRELTPEMWPELEALFGEKGACAGCWCMFWRVEDGERYADLQGAPARRRQKRLVESGRSLGVLAYVDGEPVGWAAFGRRREFSRLDRAPSLRCDDADAVWSIPCFFVKPGFRGRGVASALLDATVAAIRRRGGRLVEGYPVKLAPGARLSGAFAWTGVEPMFARAGFRVAQARPRGKQRVRRRLR